MSHPPTATRSENTARHRPNRRSARTWPARSLGLWHHRGGGDVEADGRPGCCGPSNSRPGLHSVLSVQSARPRPPHEPLPGGPPRRCPRRPAHGFLKAGQFTPALLACMQRLHSLAHARGQSLAQRALVWVLRGPVIPPALIGASPVSQTEDRLAALKNPRLIPIRDHVEPNRPKGRSLLAGDSTRRHRLPAGSSPSRESPLKSERESAAPKSPRSPGSSPQRRPGPQPA